MKQIFLENKEIPELLKVSDVVRLLGVSRPIAEQIAKEVPGISTRVGKTYRIYKSELIKYLREGESA